MLCCVWLPARLSACLPACLCIRTLPARVPQASFVGRRLLQDEDDTPTVTFPDDYPNSVRHFLLIGFLGMFIGAIVFFYMGISRKVNTVMHVLTFFVAAVSACAYYAEWAGLGVEYKTTDTTPRVIFWAHYLDWVVTGPVSPACFVCIMRRRRQPPQQPRVGGRCSRLARRRCCAAWLPKRKTWKRALPSSDV